MSMRLYLDDCAYSLELRRLLLAAGFDVQIPADMGLTGEDDSRHFDHASQEQRALITKNPSDLLELHRANPNHFGVFAVHQDNDPRDMSYADIVQALQNVLRDDPQPVAGRFIVLNQWRY